MPTALPSAPRGRQSCIDNQIRSGPRLRVLTRLSIVSNYTRTLCGSWWTPAEDRGRGCVRWRPTDHGLRWPCLFGQFGGKVRPTPGFDHAARQAVCASGSRPQAASAGAVRPPQARRGATSSGKTLAQKSPFGTVAQPAAFPTPPASTRRQSALLYISSSSRHAPSARRSHFRRTLIQTGGRNRGDVTQRPGITTPAGYPAPR